MKPPCGIRTVKGAIALGTVTTVLVFVLRLLNLASDMERLKMSASVIGIIVGATVAGVVLLWISIWMLQQCLPYYFPVACGHRKCIFTGRSSKHLREILLSVDEAIPTKQQLEEFKHNGFRYLSDVKNALEREMRTPFQHIFSGSTVERYGVPIMMSYKATGYLSALRASWNIGSLDTDVDVMFWPLKYQASFSGQGNVFIEPLLTESGGFIGHAQLTYVTPNEERNRISSKLTKQEAVGVVRNTPVVNLPGIPCCCGMTQLIPKIRLHSKGPTIKLHIVPQFEADITICIYCSEWPPLSDWATRPRYWPNEAEAQRIMSLGCHLVPKSAPNDKEKASWRFSFSLAEVELSKLVPDTARKCFLALKIILKDHLKPVAPMITSYHIKTIFFNTLEKVPVGFWVESNIEECFLTLLAELRDALLFMNCRHHWFSFINMFGKETSCFCIKTKRLQRLAKKVQIIMNNPAPFIFDDGCCCLSPCCFQAPPYNFTRRTSKKFLAEYEEVMLSADGHVIPRGQHRFGSGDVRYQPSASSSVRCDAQLDPSSYSLRGNNSHEVSIEPEQLEVPVPPIHNAEQGASLRPGDAKHETNFCRGEAKQEANVYPNEAKEEASFFPGKTEQGANFCPAKAMQKASICPEKGEKEASFCPCEAKQGANFCPDEAEQEASFCPVDGQVIEGIGTLDPGDPCNHRYQLPVTPSPRFKAWDPSIHTDANHSREIITEPEQHVAPCLPPEYDAEQDPSLCSNEVEDNSFGDSVPILVSSSFPRFLARLQQFFKVA